MLPPAVVPFPVAARYLVRPDLVRLGRLPDHVDDPGPATLVRCDDGAPRALTHALRELAEAPAAVRWADPGVPSATWRRWAQRIAEALVAENDPRVRAESGGGLAFPWLGARVGDDGTLRLGEPAAATPPPLAAWAPAARAALAGQADAAALPLDALRLAIAEDLVLLRRAAPGDGGAAAYLGVAAPSGWDPGARGGASFAELHAPVPGAEGLHRAAAAIVDAMVDRGPFVRYVWSLAASDAPSHHPGRHPAAPLPADPRGWWLRVERQTTLGLPPDATAFFIRVLHAPLTDMATSPARRSALAAAVRSMDDALLVYKGLGARRAALLAWLDAGAPR